MPESREITRARAAIEAAGGLVNTGEIASEWGVTVQAINDRVARGNFPAPIYRAGRTRLWLRSQVEPLRR